MMGIEAATAQDAPELERFRPTVRPRLRARTRWTIAIAIGVGVHAAAFFALRVPAMDAAPAPAEHPRVTWVGAAVHAEQSILHEQFTILDSAPLFLPTRWNFPVRGPEQTPSPGELFPAYGDRLTVKSAEALSDLVPAPEAIASGTEAMAEFSWPVFSVFGQTDEAPKPLERRLALVEIRSAETGAVVLTREVPASEAPDNANWGDWTPFELLLTVTPTGESTPLLGTSSAGEEVVRFFSRLLRYDFHLDLVLPAGYYRVTVGP